MQRENDQLRAQIEKSRDLGKDARDNSLVVHSIARNRGKEPIIPDDVDTLANDELSLDSSSSLSLSLTKNAWESIKAKSCKRPSHLRALSDAVSGAPIGQGGSQAGGITSQFRPLGMRRYYLKV